MALYGKKLVNPYTQDIKYYLGVPLSLLAYAVILVRIMVYQHYFHI